MLNPLIVRLLVYYFSHFRTPVGRFREFKHGFHARNLNVGPPSLDLILFTHYTQTYIYVYTYIYNIIICTYACMYLCMHACMSVCMYYIYIYIYVYTLYRCILSSCMPHMHMSADTARMMATAILHYAVAEDDRLQRLLAQEQAPFPRPPKLQRLQRLLAQQQLLRLLAQQQTHSET